MWMQELSSMAIAGIVALKAVGYIIFRSSNSQKDAYRRDPQHPSVRHLRTLPTATGRRLLVSGWWGTARHINYLGDWLMGCGSLWCAHAVCMALGQARIPTPVHALRLGFPCRVYTICIGL